jgi:hypothetical protein
MVRKPLPGPGWYTFSRSVSPNHTNLWPIGCMDIQAEIHTHLCKTPYSIGWSHSKDCHLNSSSEPNKC